MKISIFSATWLDAFAFARNWAEREWLEAQLGKGDAWKAWDNAYNSIALFGLYRRDDGCMEAWFHAREGASARMLPMVRTMRSLMRKFASAPTFCTVKPGHAPGERLARLLAFEPTGEIFNAPGTPVHGVQFWRYQP